MVFAEKQYICVMKVLLKNINPNLANPRFIRDKQFADLKKSIVQFPQMLGKRGIAVMKDAGKWVAIGGNQRYRALCDIESEIYTTGFEGRFSIGAAEMEILKDYFSNGVPVVDCSDLTPDQQRRFIIADNLPFGEWDSDALANEWDTEELKDWGLDIAAWVEDEAVDGDDEGRSATEDDYEIPDEVKTDIVLGDLFEIGPHRLLCGDSTKEEDVNKLANGKIFNIYITDPPYGVAYTGKTKDALTIKNDAMTEEQTHNLWRAALSLATYNMQAGGGIIATVPAGLLQLGFMAAMHEIGALRQCMVWDKGQMVLGHSDYHYAHEPILYGWKQGGSHYFTKDRTKTTVLRYPKPVRNADHPTMKPVELWAELIQNSSKDGWLCYDSFLGSGTTMVAAHQLNRICYGMELDPKYCQVIIDRMLKLDSSLEVKKNGQPYKNLTKTP
jgi:DNA modification methylase